MATLPASQVIAGRHFSTKFIRINVKVAPFFVEKLKVQMLPCIIVFVNGISVDRYGQSTPCSPRNDRDRG